MKVQIVEGRLVETPIRDAVGMDRRAFGEFIGPHGELASYAFGWRTLEHEDHAHMSVGIGAGNPGGGTFHIAGGLTESGFGFALVDEPFEQGLPEGGPNLKAART